MRILHMSSDQYNFVLLLQQIVNGYNAALYSLDMAKSQQEFGIYLKGTYVTLKSVVVKNETPSSPTTSSYLTDNIQSAG